MPYKLQPHQYDHIWKLAKEGWSQDVIFTRVGISKNTWYRLRREDKLIRDIIKYTHKDVRCGRKQLSV